MSPERGDFGLLHQVRAFDELKQAHLIQCWRRKDQALKHSSQNFQSKFLYWNIAKEFIHRYVHCLAVHTCYCTYWGLECSFLIMIMTYICLPTRLNAHLIIGKRPTQWEAQRACVQLPDVNVGRTRVTNDRQQFAATWKENDKMIVNLHLRCVYICTDHLSHSSFCFTKLTLG